MAFNGSLLTYPYKFPPPRLPNRIPTQPPSRIRIIRPEQRQMQVAVGVVIHAGEAEVGVHQGNAVRIGTDVLADTAARIVWLASVISRMLPRWSRS